MRPPASEIMASSGLEPSVIIHLPGRRCSQHDCRLWLESVVYGHTWICAHSSAPTPCGLAALTLLLTNDAQQANDLREAQHVPDSHASSKPCSVSTDSTIRGDRNQAASTAIPFPAALDPHAPVMSSHCWRHRKYLQTDSRHGRSISATTREDTQCKGA